jgi:hypothetical protein
MPPRKGTSPKTKDAQAYRHPDADLPTWQGIGAFELSKKPARFQSVDTVRGGLPCASGVPVLASDRSQIALEVIDPRGNEPVVVK